MSLSAQRPPKLFWLEAQPGIGFVWAGEPALPARSTRPEDWRRAALARAWAARGGSGPADRMPLLRDVTLLDGQSLDAEGLAAVLAAIRALDEPPLIRIAASLHGSGALLETLAAIADDFDDPAFVQLIVHSGEDLETSAAKALETLADRGWPLAAEAWLLRGGFATIDPLRALLRKLVALRIRPYYLVDGEWLPERLRLSEGEILELSRGLRGWISGLAVPQLVREDREGRRVPLVPEYVESAEEHQVTLRNYAGNLHIYSNPPARPKG